MDLFEAKFVLDGTECVFSLREMIESCNCGDNQNVTLSYIGNTCFGNVIIDEVTDPDLTPLEYDVNLCREYAAKIMADGIQGKAGTDPVAEARHSVAAAVSRSVWNSGKGTPLEELTAEIHIDIDSSKIGQMAMLYNAISSATDYAYEIGVRIGSCTIHDGRPCFGIRAGIGDDGMSYMKDDPEFREKICGSTIIYIPFDTSDPELGGSALASLKGLTGYDRPKILDPDYLIDSYEIIKELTDDGIVLAGRSIGAGGLICALEYLGQECSVGMDVDIEHLQESYACSDIVCTLFNEVPGVIVAVSDEDYGYIDSQMVLQDIAYYPVGIAAAGKDIRIRHRCGYNVADVLLSIINR